MCIAIHITKSFWKTTFLSPIKLKYLSLNARGAHVWTLLQHLGICLEQYREQENISKCLFVYVHVRASGEGVLTLCVSDYLCAKQKTCLQVWVDAQVGCEYYVCFLEWMQILTGWSLFRWRSGCERCVTETFVYFGVPWLSNGCAGLFGDQVIYGHLKTSGFFVILSYLMLISLILFSCSWKQGIKEKERRQRSDEFMYSTMTERVVQAASRVQQRGLQLVPHLWPIALLG